MVVAARGRSAEAVEVFGQAVADLERPLRDDPTNPSLNTLLAAVCINRGSFDRNAGRPRDALPWYDRAIRAANTALAHPVPNADAFTQRVNAHGSRAQAYEVLGDYAAAVHDWDRIVEWAAEPQRTTYRFMRLTSLARADAGRAAAEADALAAAHTADANALAHLARTCAAGAGADELAARALRLLRQAWGVAGWRDRWELVVDVTTGPDWRALRGCPEFTARVRLAAWGLTRW
jgi:tetratricopeptide (TPR) repeat protein